MFANETTLFPLTFGKSTEKLYSLYWVAEGMSAEGRHYVTLTALVAEEDFDPAVGHTAMGTVVFDSGRAANAFLRFLSGRVLTEQLISDAEVAGNVRARREMEALRPRRYGNSWTKTS